MSGNTGLPMARVEGQGVIKDKNGNIKGYIKFGGDATLAQISEFTGKSEEELRADSKSNLSSQENPNGSDSDNGRS